MVPEMQGGVPFDWMNSHPPITRDGVGQKDMHKQRHRESDHPSCRGPYSQLACLQEQGAYYLSSGMASPKPSHGAPGSSALSGLHLVR